MKEEEDVLEQALYRKALGYEADEIVEEYVVDDDGVKLSKRKVTKKHIAPDIPAVKVLLERCETRLSDRIKSMSDEELIEEKNRLLKLLEEAEDAEGNNDTQD